MDQAIVFARITKVDEAKRTVIGRAAQEVVDSVDEIFNYKGSKPYFQKWSKSISDATDGKSHGNIRAMHGKVAAGKVTEILFNDEEEAIDISTKIVDDQEWAKCLEGVYTGFSIGGKYVGEKEVVKVGGKEVKRYIANPSEISLVDRPAIPTATFFSVVKADGSTLKKDFKYVEEELTKKVEIEARKLCQADNMDPNGVHKLEDGKEIPMWKLFEDKAKEALGIKVEKTEESVPEYEVQATQEDIALFVKILNTNKLTVADAAGIILKHTDPLRPDSVLLQERAKALATKANEKGEDAWKTFLDQAGAELRKEAEGKKKPASGMAKQFADEKNRRYPIDTEDQVRAAWDYINRPANAAKYNAEDLKLVKGRVEAAWKEKVSKDGPPAAADKDLSAKELRKNLSTCANAMYLLDSLCSMQQSVQYEAYVEGDDSPIAGDMREAIKSLGEIIVRMCQEELGEEYMNEPQMMDVRGNVVSLSEKAKDLVKRADLIKAGARHSKDDMGRVQKMHDMACDLGAKCLKDDDAAAAAQVAGLVKTLGLDEEKSKALIQILKSGAGGDTQKLVEANKVLKAQLDELSKQVETLKKQPMPAMAILRAGGNVQRAKDVVVDHEKIENQEVPIIKDSLGEPHPAASAIKLILQGGGSPMAFKPDGK